MRLDTLWAVVNATPESTLADICWATNARDLQLWSRGGKHDDSLTLYTDEKEARADASCRLDAAGTYDEDAGELDRQAAAEDRMHDAVHGDGGDGLAI